MNVVYLRCRIAWARNSQVRQLLNRQSAKSSDIKQGRTSSRTGRRFVARVSCRAMAAIYRQISRWNRAKTLRSRYHKASLNQPLSIATTLHQSYSSNPRKTPKRALNLRIPSSGQSGRQLFPPGSSTAHQLRLNQQPSNPQCRRLDRRFLSARPLLL